jgi:hypothetical protein
MAEALPTKGIGLMKNRHSITTAAAALILLCGSALGTSQARADSLPLAGPPDGFAVGAFVPESSKAKQGGSTQFTGELHYGLPTIPFFGGNLVSTLGYEGGNHNGHSTIVPLTIGAYFGSGEAGQPIPYIGGGVGAYYIDQSGAGTKIRGGGYVAAGYKFSYLFAEARYQFLQDGNGFMFDVGTHF